MYERYASRGELLEDAILVHSCRLRATDPSRHFVPCEGYQRKRDVLDPRNYLEGTVEVLHFGEVVDEVDGAPVHIGFAELDSTNPTKQIVSAISLEEWLETLAPRDRELIELRAAGYDLEESAERLGWSATAVCRRVKQLGEELAEHAGMQSRVYRQQRERLKARSRAAGNRNLGIGEETAKRCTDERAARRSGRENGLIPVHLAPEPDSLA
jgi:DNA-directed RNA polymerase specialized sigma24 family protein